MQDEAISIETTDPISMDESGLDTDLTVDQDNIVTEALKPEQDAAPTAPPVEKQFTQEELDAVVGKRLAIQERKLKRELATPEPEPLKIESKLDPDSFDTTEDYVEALATEKAEAIISHQAKTKQTSDIDTSFFALEDKAVEKYDDYLEVAHNPAIKITQEMAEVIKTSDEGPEIAYHLGKNPEEAARIAQLPPLAQARELGKLEGNLNTKKGNTTPDVTKAPDPITPVSGEVSSFKTRDTTDPRSSESMSATEWIEADRARRMKLAQNNQ